MTSRSSGNVSSATYSHINLGVIDITMEKESEMILETNLAVVEENTLSSGGSLRLSR